MATYRAGGGVSRTLARMDHEYIGVKLPPDILADVKRVAADDDVANANSVFGKFIDHRLEVIRGSDDANSVNGAPEHFRVVIQYGHNAMQIR